MPRTNSTRFRRTRPAKAFTATPKRLHAPPPVAGPDRWGGGGLVLGIVAFLILPNLAGSTQRFVQHHDAGAAADVRGTVRCSHRIQQCAARFQRTQQRTDASESPSATPSSAPVDKATPVAVYNGAGTAGLAGRVAGLVQGDGWALSTVGNWGGLPQQTSVIFYNAPEQKANAEALGTLLGIQTIVETPEVQQPLVVVAGPGYQ